MGMLSLYKLRELNSVTRSGHKKVLDKQKSKGLQYLRNVEIADIKASVKKTRHWLGEHSPSLFYVWSTLTIEQCSFCDIWGKIHKSINSWPNIKSEAGQAVKAYGECLGIKGRWRTWLDCDKPRQAVKQAQPGISEWGNSSRFIGKLPAEHIGWKEVSGGSETSQYPEEKKIFSK